MTTAAQWWKSRSGVCAMTICRSLQASITTRSLAEPAGAATNSTPLYRQHMCMVLCSVLSPTFNTGHSSRQCEGIWRTLFKSVAVMTWFDRAYRCQPEFTCTAEFTCRDSRVCLVWQSSTCIDSNSTIYLQSTVNVVRKWKERIWA